MASNRTTPRLVDIPIVTSQKKKMKKTRSKVMGQSLKSQKSKNQNILLKEHLEQIEVGKFRLFERKRASELRP